jgi:hypothetical protein
VAGSPTSTVAAATSGADLEQSVGWLARWISDGAFLRLVRRALAALSAPLAPGSGLTPMLTNLRLARTHERLSGLVVVRLTDNYTAFCRTRAEAEQSAALITAALATCGLTPNPAKSKVWQPNPRRPLPRRVGHEREP